MNFENILSQVKRLPPNPQIMLKLLRLLQDINTDPNDIVAALKRGIAATERGQAALIEFITAKEIEISNE